VRPFVICQPPSLTSRGSNSMAKQGAGRSRFLRRLVALLVLPRLPFASHDGRSSTNASRPQSASGAICTGTSLTNAWPRRVHKQRINAGFYGGGPTDLIPAGGFGEGHQALPQDGTIAPQGRTLASQPKQAVARPLPGTRALQPEQAALSAARQVTSRAKQSAVLSPGPAMTWPHS
jgi:hypothetical protein